MFVHLSFSAALVIEGRNSILDQVAIVRKEVHPLESNADISSVNVESSVNIVTPLLTSRENRGAYDEGSVTSFDGF